MAERIRPTAERHLLLLIVSFVVALVGTRWFLDLTGYPQVGGGELHVAHMLWGGLLLILAALVILIVASPRSFDVAAILAGAGTGLFIDEVGKFITASNDYFYPPAAPLIYGLLLVLILVFLVLRHAGRRAAEASADTVARRPPGRTMRVVLSALLAIQGAGWLLVAWVFSLFDQATLRALLEALQQTAAGPVERPTEPFFYTLEATILGASGALLVVAAIALLVRRDWLGTTLAIIGLAVALTAGALVSLYVEQVSAILATLINAGLLLWVLRFRGRTVG